MNRGEVWWTELPQPAGRRPVVLVSRVDAYRVRNQVVVAEVTSRIRSLSAEVRLDQSDGMPKVCAAQFDTFHTIRKNRILSFITTLTPQRMIEMNDAIHFALGLDN